MSEHETNVKEKMSEADETMDELVEAASVPSLSTLFERARNRGVIGAVTVYGEKAPV